MAEANTKLLITADELLLPFRGGREGLFISGLSPCGCASACRALMMVLSENIWKHPAGCLQGFSGKSSIELDEGELHNHKGFISVFVNPLKHTAQLANCNL